MYTGHLTMNVRSEIVNCYQGVTMVKVSCSSIDTLKEEIASMHIVHEGVSNTKDQ